MSTYGWTENHVLDELDGAKGWVYFNWSYANEQSVWSTGVVIKGDGYIAQERKQITAEKKHGTTRRNQR